ncbi:hypothetical protein AAC387_Pa01g3677 [Persea americana]
MVAILGARFHYYLQDMCKFLQLSGIKKQGNGIRFDMGDVLVGDQTAEMLMLSTSVLNIKWAIKGNPNFFLHLLSDFNSKHFVHELLEEQKLLALLHVLLYEKEAFLMVASRQLQTSYIIHSGDVRRNALLLGSTNKPAVQYETLLQDSSSSSSFSHLSCWVNALVSSASVATLCHGST